MVGDHDVVHCNRHHDVDVVAQAFHQTVRGRPVVGTAMHDIGGRRHSSSMDEVDRIRADGVH
jgi:hypothetical protein